MFTHARDILTHYLVDVPVDGVKTIGTGFSGSARGARRQARLERLAKLAEENRKLDSMKKAEQEREDHQRKLRQAALLIETGQRMAAEGHDELSALKAKGHLADKATSDKAPNGAGRKAANDDPAPEPKGRTRSKLKSVPETEETSAK